MNIHYIVYLPNWKKSQGVVNKICNQVKTWLELSNHEISLTYISQTPILDFESIDLNVQHISYESRKHKFLTIRKTLALLEGKKTDIIYLRSIVPFPGMKKLLKKYTVIVETNSIVLKEIKLRKKNEQISNFNYYKNIIGHKLKKYASGIVAVTNEAKLSDKEFNKPSVVIPNSIANFEIVKMPKKNKVPRLFFMGSPNQDWHGTDKIIELAKKTEDSLEFHIIGITDKESETLKNVFYYGYLNQEGINKVISQCDIGISTLALHRMNMNETSPLKTREYLAKGFPIISGYYDSMLDQTSEVPHFILQLPNDETNVIDNIDRIISFSKSKQSYVVEKEEVYQIIGSTPLEKKRLDFMERIYNQKN